MVDVDVKYMPTGQDEGNWGWVMDNTWGPLCSSTSPRRFWADAHMALHNAKREELSNDYALAHSFLRPGEHDCRGLDSWIDGKQLQEEELEWFRAFQGVFVFSDWMAENLEERGVTVLGKIKYPTPIQHIERAHRQRLEKPTVVIGQRFHPEKFPLWVMELAKRMPDVDFVWTRSRGDRPDGVWGLWLDMAPANFSFRVLDSKQAFLDLTSRSLCGLVSGVGDTFGVSGVETLAMGVPYVAPNLIAFPEYVPAELLYKPFCLEDAERAIRSCSDYVVEKGYPWTRKEAVQDFIAKVGRR